MTISPTGGDLSLVIAGPALADTLDPATPFKRLLGSMATSYAGAFVVSVVPVTLLLTVHLSAIAGAGTASAFSLVTGVASLLALIVQPLTGRLSDRTTARFGKRRTWILTGGLVGSPLLLGMIATTEVWQVVVVWTLVSIFTQVQLAATGALLAEQVPAKRRGSLSGVLGSMAIVGPVLGLAAVSPFTSMLWLQWIVVAGSGVLLVLISVSLLHDPQQQRSPDEPRNSARELVRSFWLSPKRHPAFGWAWAVRFLVTCTGASTAYNALLLINRFHYTPAEVATPVLQLTLVYGGLIVVFSTIGGVLSDKLGRQKPFVMFAGVIAAAALVMVALAQTVSALFLAIAVLGVGAGIFLSVDLALSVRMLPNSEHLGKDIGVLSLASTLPGSIVPFVAPLFLLIGGYTALYIGLAVFGIVGAVLATRLPELGHEGDRRWALITAPTTSTTKGD